MFRHTPLCRRLALFLLLALALAVQAPRAQATTLMGLSIADLAQGSELVLRGVVSASRCEKDPASGRLYTYTTITSGSAYKGKPAKSLVVRQIGGSWQGLEQWIPGTPRLLVGQELVLFLIRENDLYFLKGMSQGLFEVVRENGVEMAIQNMNGASVANKDPVSGRLQAEIRPGQRLLLGDLQKQISAALRSKP